MPLISHVFRFARSESCQLSSASHPSPNQPKFSPGSPLRNPTLHDSSDGGRQRGKGSGTWETEERVRRTSGVQDVTNSNMQDWTNSNVQDVQDVTNSNVRDPTNSNMQDVTNSNVRDPTNSNMQDVTNSDSEERDMRTSAHHNMRDRTNSHMGVTIDDRPYTLRHDDFACCFVPANPYKPQPFSTCLVGCSQTGFEHPAEIQQCYVVCLRGRERCRDGRGSAVRDITSSQLSTCHTSQVVHNRSHRRTHSEINARHGTIRSRSCSRHAENSSTSNHANMFSHADNITHGCNAQINHALYKSITTGNQTTSHTAHCLRTTQVHNHSVTDKTSQRDIFNVTEVLQHHPDTMPTVGRYGRPEAVEQHHMHHIARTAHAPQLSHSTHFMRSLHHEAVKQHYPDTPLNIAQHSVPMHFAHNIHSTHSTPSAQHETVRQQHSEASTNVVQHLFNETVNPNDQQTPRHSQHSATEHRYQHMLSHFETRQLEQPSLSTTPELDYVPTRMHENDRRIELPEHNTGTPQPACTHNHTTMQAGVNDTPTADELSWVEQARELVSQRFGNMSADEREWYNTKLSDYGDGTTHVESDNSSQHFNSVYCPSYRMSYPSTCESITITSSLHERFVDVNIREQHELGHAKSRAKQTRSHQQHAFNKGLLFEHDHHETSKSSNIKVAKRTDTAPAQAQELPLHSADQRHNMQSPQCERIHDSETRVIHSQASRSTPTAQAYEPCLASESDDMNTECPDQAPAFTSSYPKKFATTSQQHKTQTTEGQTLRPTINGLTTKVDDDSIPEATSSLGFKGESTCISTCAQLHSQHHCLNQDRSLQKTDPINSRESLVKSHNSVDLIGSKTMGTLLYQEHGDDYSEHICSMPAYLGLSHHDTNMFSYRDEPECYNTAAQSPHAHVESMFSFTDNGCASRRHANKGVECFQYEKGKYAESSEVVTVLENCNSDAYIQHCHLPLVEPKLPGKQCSYITQCSVVILPTSMMQPEQNEGAHALPCANTSSHTIIYCASCPGCMHEFTDRDVVDPNDTEHEPWICCICPSCCLPWQGMPKQVQNNTSACDVTHIVLFRSEDIFDPETDSADLWIQDDTVRQQDNTQHDRTASNERSQIQPHKDNTTDIAGDTQSFRETMSQQRLQTKGQKVDSSSDSFNDATRNMSRNKTDQHHTVIHRQTEGHEHMTELERFVLIPAKRRFHIDSQDIQCTELHSRPDNTHVQTEHTDHDSTDSTDDDRDNDHDEQRTGANGQVQTEQTGERITGGKTREQTQKTNRGTPKPQTNKHDTTWKSRNPIGSYEKAKHEHRCELSIIQQGTSYSELAPGKTKQFEAPSHDSENLRNCSVTAPRHRLKPDWLKRIPCRGCGSRYHADCTRRQQKHKCATTSSAQPNNQTQATTDNQHNPTPGSAGRIDIKQQQSTSCVGEQELNSEERSQKERQSHTISTTTTRNEKTRVQWQ